MLNSLMRFLPLAALALPAVASPTYLTQTIYIFINTGCTSNCINTPGGASLTNTYTNTNNGQAATIIGSSLLPENGFEIGAKSSVSLTNASAGQYQVISQNHVSDTIAITGVPAGSQTVQFIYELDGSFSFPSPAFGLENVSLSGGLTAGPGGPFLGTGGGVQSLSNATIDQFITVTNFVQFTGNPSLDRFSYGMFLQTNTDATFSGSSNQTAVLTADFSATARLTGFHVLNGAGQPIPGAQALDSNGQDLTGVPEPGSMSLAAIGLCVALAVRARLSAKPA
jgi:hypothetical protein